MAQINMQLILHRICLRRKRGNMKEFERYKIKDKFKSNKELICYIVLMLFLIILVICNNVFWKLGKQTENNIDYLESNNIIYDVPYEERVLD